MKVGKEITQEQSDQLRQALTDHLTTTQGNTPEGTVALQLVTGMSTGIWNALLEALMAKAIAWVQDPNNIQFILSTILGLFTKKS